MPPAEVQTGESRVHDRRGSPHGPSPQLSADPRSVPVGRTVASSAVGGGFGSSIDFWRAVHSEGVGYGGSSTVKGSMIQQFNIFT